MASRDSRRQDKGKGVAGAGGSGSPIMTGSGRGRGIGIGGSGSPQVPTPPSITSPWTPQPQVPYIDHDPIFGDEEPITPGAMGYEFSPHESINMNAPSPTPIPEEMTPGSMPPRPPRGGRRAPQPRAESDIFRVHFEKICLPDGTITHAKCNYCGNEYAHNKGGGYGSLNRHIEKKHPDKVGNLRSQTQIRFAPDQTGAPSTQLFTFSQARYRDKIAETIAVERLAFQFAESCQYNECVTETLQPAARSVSRRTIQRTIHKQYKQGKENLCEFFRSSNCCVSLCSDIWTDSWRENAFMGVTAHWIDDDWIIQKRVIAFRVFNESHTAENIYRLMRTIIEEYSISFKIFSISFDNASANTASIPLLEEYLKPICDAKYFHIRCACHVLNLCVQSGLESLKEYIGPIRDVIMHISGKSNLMKQWARYCRANNMKSKKFPLDVKTRWNSTYRLLSETWPYKNLLTNFVNDSIPGFQLYEQHWIVANKVMNLLSVFNTATNLFSQVYFPTAHLFLALAIDIAEQIDTFRDETQLVEGLNEMHRKWISYYKYIPPIALIAFVLDPRHKLFGLSEYLEAYYKFLGISQDEINITNIITDVRTQLINLYQAYCIRYSHLTPQVQNQEQEEGSSNRVGILGGRFRQRHAHKRPRESAYTEIDLYLNTVFRFKPEQNADINFNILEWWKTNGNPYPILSIIVRDVLACPMSTVACEQTFSASGNMLDTTRSRLTPLSVEIQVCVDDWKRAQTRAQEAETGSPEVSDFFFTDNMSSTASSTAQDCQPNDSDEE